jgi:Protein involved in biosynthesis of mitomycin antibiotics/polyketide fumonisin
MTAPGDDNNNCTLLGIVPAERDIFYLVRNQFNANNVSWSDEYAIVPDQENEGVPTLIMSAIMRMHQTNKITSSDNGDDSDCDVLNKQQNREDVRLQNLEALDKDDETIKTPQDLVKCVTEFLKTRSKNKEDFHLQVELWASAPAPLPLWNAARMSHCSTSITTSMDTNHGDEEDGESTSISKNKQEQNEDYCDDGGGLVVVVDPSLFWSKEKAYTNLRKWGIYIQKKILNLVEVKNLRSIVDEAIQEVELSLAMHRPDIHVGRDTIIFKEIASRNLERFDLRLTSDAALNFVKDHVLQSDIVQDFLTRCLDGDSSEIDFDVSVVYSKPGAITQGWHADGAHLSTVHDAGWDEDGWKTRLADAYAICLFIPLIDLNYEVGYTQFWPGSHRSRELVGFGPVAELTCSTFDAIGSAGDGIWYDYRLLHRGMPNNSSNTIRPVVQILFKKKWYVERANYGMQSVVPRGGNRSNNNHQQ